MDISERYIVPQVVTNGPRSELTPILLSTMAHNPFTPYISPSRGVMDCNHMAGTQALLYPQRKDTVIGGVEYELGKYIDDVKSDMNCVVKAQIHKYPDFGVKNPETTLLVEYEFKDEEGRSQIGIDLIVVKKYESKHTYFGYPLYPTETMKNAKYGTMIPKNTILAQSSCYINLDGSYAYGVNANVLPISLPGTGEDGFMIRRGFLPNLTFTTLIKRSQHLTKTIFPVNSFGDDKTLKMFPDIGEGVKGTKLVFGVRERRELYSITDMNDIDIKEADYTFDDNTYTVKNDYVIDVNVIRGNPNKIVYSEDMRTQLDYYHNARVAYSENIIAAYNDLLREMRARFGINFKPFERPRLIQRMTECEIDVEYKNSKNKRKLCDAKRVEIDQYYVEVITMSEVIPNIGFKMTDMMGGKGTLTGIIDDDKCPRDMYGNVADIITDAEAPVFGRMIPGKAYEGYMGATVRDNNQRLFNPFIQKYGPEFMYMLSKPELDYLAHEIRNIYSLTNPDVVEWFDGLGLELQYQHVKEVAVEGLLLYMPTDNKYNLDEIVEAIRQTKYRPNYGPFSFVDEYGEMVTTQAESYMSRMYLLTLDRTGRDFSSVNSAKVNSYVLPIKGSETDRVGYPHSQTPVTNLGETETRSINAHAGPEMVAEMHDITLNPTSHKLLAKEMLEGDMMYNPMFDIDRTLNPYGKNKSLLTLKHVFAAAGFEMVHQKEEE